MFDTECPDKKHRRTTPRSKSHGYGFHNDSWHQDKPRFKAWEDAHCFEPDDYNALGSFAAVENAVKAVVALGSLTASDSAKCGGKLLLRGTRFSIAQLIAEIADDGESVRNVCEDYDLDYDQVVNVLHALASGISAPVA